MSRVVVRTIYGSEVQTARNMGLAHDISGDFSALHYGGVPVLGKGALNNNLCVPNLPTSILQGMQTAPAYNALVDTNNIKLQYFCIGNRGHRYIPGAPPAPAYTSPVPHRATDSGLYGWMPFLIRPYASDITGATRAKYRLRRTLLIGGNLYVAYFAKVLDFTGVLPETNLVIIDNGAPISSPFNPTSASLAPDPTLVTNSLITDNNGSYTSVAATLSIPFTAQEVTELMNAMDLVYGDSNFAIISEVALCTGVDKLCDTQYSDVSPYTSSVIGAGNPTEAVGVQIATHISTHYPVVYANDGFGFNLDLGATEPLFGVGTL